MSRAIFLDQDNTIVKNDGYLGDPAQVEILPGVAEGIAALRAQGYKIVIVSNQAGVAHGYFDEAAVEAVRTEIERQLLVQNPEAKIDRAYYCFYHDKPKTKDEALLKKWKHPDHPWRKPNAGMLIQAAQDLQLKLIECWMAGDSLKDVEAGQAAWCKTILVRNPAISQSPDADKGSENTRPDFSCTLLTEAAAIVEQNTPNAPTI